MQVTDDGLVAGSRHNVARGGILQQLGIAFIVVKGHLDDGRIHLVVDRAVEFAVRGTVHIRGVVGPIIRDNHAVVRPLHVGFHFVIDRVAEGLLQLLLGRGAARVIQAHRAAAGAGAAVGVGVKSEINAVPEPAIVRAVHLCRHAHRGADIVIRVAVAGKVVNRGGHALAKRALNPIARRFEFPLNAGDPIPAVHIAHAVAETDGVGDDHVRRGVIAGGRIIGYFDKPVGSGLKIVIAQPDPAEADAPVVHAHLGYPAAVANTVQLLDAVGPAPRPAVNGIETGAGDVGRVARHGALSIGVDVGVAVGYVARRAEENGRGAVRPRAGEGDAAVVIVEHNLVGLVTDRSHRHDRCPGVETVLHERVELVNVAHVLDHAIGQPAARDPRRTAGREPVAGAGKDDDIRKRAAWLLVGGLAGGHAAGAAGLARDNHLSGGCLTGAVRPAHRDSIRTNRQTRDGYAPVCRRRQHARAAQVVRPAQLAGHIGVGDAADGIAGRTIGHGCVQGGDSYGRIAGA